MNFLRRWGGWMTAVFFGGMLLLVGAGALQMDGLWSSGSVEYNVVGRSRVHYERGASDVGAKGNVARIEMGYRFDDGVAAMSVVADGQRNLQGVLVRRAPAIRIPADARKELQLWFKLEMEDGSVFWDSAFSRNYRLAVLPQW